MIKYTFLKNHLIKRYGVALNKYENTFNDRGSQAKERTFSLAYFCVDTDKKGEEVFYDWAFKNHYDEYVLVSIEGLVSLNHFLFMSEATVRTNFILL